MKKFNKDQIQKMVFSVILLVALLYCYFQFGLSPLKGRDAANAIEIAAVQTKLDEAKQHIQKGKNAQLNAENSVVNLATINKMIRPEAPIAWLPPLLADFFTKQGLANISVKPIRKDAVTQEGLADYRNYYWIMEAPQVPFVKMAAALSELENTQPLLAIRSIKLEADTSNPEQQRFTCELKTILK